MYEGIFLGIVVDNNDPDRDNKCRVRVINVFDGLDTSDIPWATAFKSNSGTSCDLPNLGKVVTVHFENGDLYNPIYRYSEHYNVNLKSKLNSLSDSDYLSMKALIFEHRTQVYSNESEGLVLDHKFNKINLTESNINLELKDNYGSIKLGSADADQQAILGNNFFEWFDILVDELLGNSGGPYLGNLGAPVIANPNLVNHLLKYKTNRDTKFLSHNISMNDNGYIDKLDRVNINSIGDNWKSVKEDNTVSSTNNETDYVPKDGIKTSTPSGILTSSEELDGDIVENTPIDLEIDTTSINQDIQILIKALQNKNYKIFTGKFEMNIIGVRYQYEGQEYSNKFVDKMFVFYKDENNLWKINRFRVSTLPGTHIKITNSRYSKFKSNVDKSVINTKITLKKYCQYIGRTGLGILQPAQYINSFKLGYFPSSGKYKSRALKSVGKQLIYRDSNWDSLDITYSAEEEGYFGMHLHRGFEGGVLVNNWSEGCQVFENGTSLDKFMDLMEIHKKVNGDKFSYTLITSKDFDRAESEIELL